MNGNTGAGVNGKTTTPAPLPEGNSGEMDEMTMAEFREFKAAKALKEKKARQAADRDAYRDLVSKTVEEVFPDLLVTSEALMTAKSRVYDAFACALDLKENIFEVKPDQRSHTFTNKLQDRRVTIGYYVNDGYDDTVEEGIAKVKEFIGSLAKDAESKMLVGAVLKLLSKDQKGNLKASRVMQLRKMADDSGNEMFIEGVKIIEEAYRPVKSKTFVRAEEKTDKGAWINVPLGMTEA